MNSPKLKPISFCEVGQAAPMITQDNNRISVLDHTELQTRVQPRKHAVES